MSAAATIAAYAAIASAVVTGYKALSSKDSGPQPMPPPAAPAGIPAINSPQIEAAGEMERRKAAAAGGIMENIRTSPLGDQSIASTTGKSLLGQ